jgi:hypothetical protein
MATQSVQKQVEDEQAVEEEDLLTPAELAGDVDVPEPEKESDLSSLEEKVSEPAVDASDDITEKIPFLKNVPKDVDKPEQVAPRDAQDQEYFDEHKALPTEEERPDQEVQEDEAIQRKEREQAAKEIEAHKDEQGTLSGLEKVQAAQANKSQDVIVVEGIMSEGLEEQFKALSPQEQAAFKQAGEQAAQEVATLLDQAKVQFKKILEVLRKWLGMLPRTNKYHLEQESKIKLDKLLKYKNEQEGQLPE